MTTPVESPRVYGKHQWWMDALLGLLIGLTPEIALYGSLVFPPLVGLCFILLLPYAVLDRMIDLAGLFRTYTPSAGYTWLVLAVATPIYGLLFWRFWRRGRKALWCGLMLGFIVTSVFSSWLRGFDL